MKKISHDEFTEAIARHLKADEILVGSRIDDFVTAFRSDLKETGSATIEGLGKFVLENDKLTFDPDPTLALEINYKYAGLDAIELLPGYVNKLKSDSEKSKPGSKTLTPWQPDVEDNKGPDSDKSLPDNLITSEKEGDGNSEKNDVTTPPCEDEENTLMAAGVQTPKAFKDTPDKAPKDIKRVEDKTKDSNTDRPIKTSGEDKKNGAGNNLLYIVAAAAAIFIFALYIYQAGYIIPFDVNGGTSTQVITLEDPEDSVTQLPSANHELRQGEEPEENIIETTPGEHSDETTLESRHEESGDVRSPYGLFGELADVNRSFTIVVHSLPTYRMASTERDKIRSGGYRATLYSVPIETGNETWRVGIGQFETIDDAVNAARELDEPYKSRHFIARIRN